MSLVCVQQPAVEPVTLEEFCRQIRVDAPDDPAEQDELMGFVTAARAAIEGYCRRALVLQSWEWSEERPHPLWERLRRREDRGVALPYAPLLAVDSVAVEYPDDSASVVELIYRVHGRGDDTAPGRVYVPCSALGFCGRLVIRWRAGYGGTIGGLTVQGTAVSGYVFTQGDVGLPLKMGSTATRIVSVDAEGVATIADAPTGLPEGVVSGYLGWPIPSPILQAIKLLAADFEANREATPPAGSVAPADDDLPVTVRRLLKFSRNLLS